MDHCCGPGRCDGQGRRTRGARRPGPYSRPDETAGLRPRADPHGPTPAAVWTEALATAKAEFGLGSREVPYCADVLLDAAAVAEALHHTLHVFLKTQFAGTDSGKPHDGASEMPRQHRGKTVAKPFGLTLLELPLSEKQIPQVVEKFESGGKPKEALETAELRPRQVRYQAALRPDISSFFDFKPLPQLSILSRPHKSG